MDIKTRNIARFNLNHNCYRDVNLNVLYFILFQIVSELNEIHLNFKFSIFLTFAPPFLKPAFLSNSHLSFPFPLLLMTFSIQTTFQITRLAITNHSQIEQQLHQWNRIEHQSHSLSGSESRSQIIEVGCL